MKTDSRFRSAFSLFVIGGLAMVVLFPAITGCTTMAPGSGVGTVARTGAVAKAEPGTDAGAGAVAYVRGDLESTLAKDYNAVVDATRGAIKDLEFAKISDNKDAFKALLTARTALDKKVEITVTNSGKNLTNIKIRVGVFGDEQLSLAIFEKIKAGS